jgi:hypothetical protein
MHAIPRACKRKSIAMLLTGPWVMAADVTCAAQHSQDSPNAPGHSCWRGICQAVAFKDQVHIAAKLDALPVRHGEQPVVI